MEAAFYDLKTLFALRDLIERLDPEGPPDLSIVFRNPARSTPARLGILPGAFNPLTNAHVELARLALAVYALDEVLFAASRVTVEKEMIRDACLEDRLLLLRLYVERHDAFGVVLMNRGLYVEQALGLRRGFPAPVEFFFLVGFDKLVQIFDPRYYADRDAALHALFQQASLIVASRGGRDLQDLEALLERQENREFRGKILPLQLPETYQHLSSTFVREEVRRGRPIGAYVPEEVEAFIQETGLYARPRQLSSGEEVDAYALRVALFEVLSRARPWAAAEADLKWLFECALHEAGEGRALRAFLRHPPEGPLEETLKQFQAGGRG